MKITTELYLSYNIYIYYMKSVFIITIGPAGSGKSYIEDSFLKRVQSIY